MSDLVENPEDRLFRDTVKIFTRLKYIHVISPAMFIQTSVKSVLSCHSKVDKTNKNIIMSSFKSSGDIQKKEGGPDSCFG